jgi:hypothetical protein
LRSVHDGATAETQRCSSRLAAQSRCRHENETL